MKIPHYLRTICLALLILAIPAASFAGVFVSISIAPPALPVYTQPLCPGPGYIWTPGYWAYGPEGYYWVPGTWVVAPAVGLLWTPGYWGWGGGFYAWHAGYWGPHIGFYGGINYGFGYTGVGYAGGYWRGGVFNYNRSVNNVNVTNVTNVYNTTVVNNTNVNHVSYNGGTGGVMARPTNQELAAEHERHIQPTALQTQHEQTASQNRSLLASVNHGSPAIAATARPGEFSGHGVVAAKQAGAPYNPARENAAARTNATRTNNVPRPGNSAGEARPGTATANNSVRSNVPRPPSSVNNSNVRRNESRPETSARNQNVPRPPASSRPQTATRESVPRAVNNANHTAPRPQHTSAPRESAPRAESHPAGHGGEHLR